MLLVTSEQMRAFDKHTIQTLRVPGIVLMELAGKAVADTVAKRHPRHVTVLAGKGNNGGDGWVAARWLKHCGIALVEVVSLIDPAELQGDAQTALAAATAVGVPWVVWPETGGLAEADVIVDAMLGTGSGRAPEGAVRDAILAVRDHPAVRIAVDIPTGVDASTGEVPGIALRADETVAIGFAKVGHLVTPGQAFAGRVTVADIGIEPDGTDGLAECPDAAWVSQRLPVRGTMTHKGTYGRLGVLLGEMHGAAMLAGRGAARIGAGMVVIGGAVASLQGAPHEFVLRDAASRPTPFADCSAVVIGPGLGEDRRADAMAIAASWTGVGVLDADALHPDALDAGALQPDARLDGLGERWVLTPHPKECARLLGWTTDQVNAQRIAAVRALSSQTGAVVVLKGYHSLVASPAGGLWVNPTGNAALATAGTGDVLAGVIGGLLAQGLSPVNAAVAGVWIHGRAGEVAGQAMHPASVMASDVVDAISRAIPLHFDKSSEDARRADR